MQENSVDQHQSVDGVEFLTGENQRLREMLNRHEEELSQLRENNDYLVFRTEYLEELNKDLQETVDSYVGNSGRKYCNPRAH
jgi:hypothetical protein